MQFLADIQFNTHLEEITFCKYNLRLQDKNIKLTFPQLLHLRNKVFELTTPFQLSEIIDNENYVLLFVADKEHVLFLEIPQLLDLKEEISCFFCHF